MIGRERDAKAAALRDKDVALSEKGVALQEADGERRRAEVNYRTAREAVDRLFTGVAEDLRDQPHMEQIRRKLLQDALRFYRGFLNDRADSSELKFETATAYHRVAEIFAALGDWNGCLTNERSADQLLEGLLRSSPAKLEFRLQQARGRYLLAESLQRLGKHAEAKVLLEDGLDKWESLNREFSRPPEYLEELLRLQILARDLFYYPYEDWARFVALGKSTAELTKEIETRYPAYALSEQGLDRFEKIQVYEIPKDPQKLRELEEFFRERMNVAEAAATAHPDAPSYQSNLASLLSALTTILLAEDRFAELEPLLLRCLAIREDLARRFPDDLPIVMSSGDAHYEYAMLLYFLGREAEARDHFRQGIRLISFGMQKEPNVQRHVSHAIGALIYCPLPDLRDPDRAVRLAQVYGDVGDKIISQVNAGLYEQARKTCQDALRSYEAGKGTVRFFPESLVPIIQMLEAFCNWHLNDQEDAKRQFLRAKGIFDQSASNQYWYNFRYRLKVREIEKEMGIETTPRGQNPQTQDASRPLHQEPAH